MYMTRWRMLLATVGLGCMAMADYAPAAEPTQVDDGFEVREQDWPWWRGPARNGTAHSEQSPPMKFNPTENLVWKAEVPGRGYGSPIVYGGRVLLATADEESGSQSVMCFDRASGEVMWHTPVHASGGMRKNNKATLASSTPACDGQLVFINFPNDDALITSALTLDGELAWQRRISSYVVHQGYGSSPALYQNLVIVSADNKGGGAVAALERSSGEVVWKRERPQKPNYPSPILLHAAGNDQLVMVGCDQVVSYDPLTGETNWETEGATTECVTSTLTDGKLVFTSGGYPENHMSAIHADGSGKLAWKNDSRLYVPSLVTKDGYLYGVLDAGIAVCWEAATGKEMWKARVGGTFSSSPVVLRDLIFISNEAGELFIFKASPDDFELVAKNQIGDEVFATPAIVDGQIFHRVAHRSSDGQRQEMLYCFGKQQ